MPSEENVLPLLRAPGSRPRAASLGRYGAGRVIAVDDPGLARHSNSAVARIVAEVAQAEHATIVFFPASQMGKDIAPRVAVKLGAGLAADCIAVRVDGNDIIATRPVFAGKALLDVRVTTPVKIFTLRPNIFDAEEQAAEARVELRNDPSGRS